jgi:hypothetical protein
MQGGQSVIAAALSAIALWRVLLVRLWEFADVVRRERLSQLRKGARVDFCFGVHAHDSCSTVFGFIPVAPGRCRKQGSAQSFPLPFNYFPNTACFLEDSIHCIAKVMGTQRILGRHWF